MCQHDSILLFPASDNEKGDPIGISTKTQEGAQVMASDPIYSELKGTVMLPDGDAQYAKIFLHKRSYADPDLILNSLTEAEALRDYLDKVIKKYWKAYAGKPYGGKRS